jgi:hypothetical protein
MWLANERRAVTKPPASWQAGSHVETLRKPQMLARQRAPGLSAGSIINEFDRAAVPIELRNNLVRTY